MALRQYDGDVGVTLADGQLVTGTAHVWADDSPTWGGSLLLRLHGRTVRHGDALAITLSGQPPAVATVTRAELISPSEPIDVRGVGPAPAPIRGTPTGEEARLAAEHFTVLASLGVGPHPAGSTIEVGELDPGWAQELIAVGDIESEEVPNERDRSRGRGRTHQAALPEHQSA